MGHKEDRRKETLIQSLFNEGYGFNDVHYFADELWQNLNPLKESIANFKEWVADNKLSDTKRF